MDIIQIVGVGIIGAVLAIVLGQYKKEYSMLLSVCSGLLILFLIIQHIEPIIDTMSAMLHTANMSGGYVDILFKSIGICFLTQMAVDVCKDAGNSAIATKIEMSGRVAILIIALPLFTSLLDLVASLISL